MYAFDFPPTLSVVSQSELTFSFDITLTLSVGALFYAKNYNVIPNSGVKPITMVPLHVGSQPTRLLFI